MRSIVGSLSEQITQLTTALEQQKRAAADQLEALAQAFTHQNEALAEAFTHQHEAFKEEIVAAISTQLASIQIPSTASPSYAAIARTPPASQPSNLASLSVLSRTPSNMTDTLYCTVDTSWVEEDKLSDAQPGAIRTAIEKEMRTKEGYNSWKCAAVIRDQKNTARIRVACRDETELNTVKQAAEKAATTGMRILRDQLYPVKVDNVNRCAVINELGQPLPGIAERLGKENNVQIAELAWLSKKDSAKAYGSMVVYVTKGSEVTRLLQEQYFHVAGESAFTRIFEPRSGPIQCYRCQAIGHKAFSCRRPQVCGKCAVEGHHHNDCMDDAMPRCVPCGGPHESFSRQCQILYPLRHD